MAGTCKMKPWRWPHWAHDAHPRTPAPLGKLPPEPTPGAQLGALGLWGAQQHRRGRRGDPLGPSTRRCQPADGQRGWLLSCPPLCLCTHLTDCFFLLIFFP